IFLLFLARFFKIANWLETRTDRSLSVETNLDSTGNRALRSGMRKMAPLPSFEHCGASLRPHTAGGSSMKAGKKLLLGRCTATVKTYSLRPRLAYVIIAVGSSLPLRAAETLTLTGNPEMPATIRIQSHRVPSTGTGSEPLYRCR